MKPEGKPTHPSKLKTKKVFRKPILLSPNSIALIHIFTRHDHLEDTWTSDVPAYYRDIKNIPKEAAKEFVRQLDKHWTPAFLKALRDEIDETLKRHNKEYQGI